MADGTRVAIDVGGEEYDVLHCRIDEQLDEIPRLEAKLWKEGALPKPVSLLGQEVSLKLGTHDAFDSAPRLFKGKIHEAERRFDGVGRPYVRIVASPDLFKLTKRTDVRTFQKKKVDEIVTEVLKGAGISKVRTSLTGSYEPREYVVQYRETDFDFVRRLLGEEGIAFSFDHDAEEVVFFDDPHGLGDAPDKSMPYRPEFGFEQGGATVMRVTERARVVSDKTYLREYDFKRPRYTVEGNAEGTDDGQHALEVYAFPARSVKDGVVKRFTQVLLDAIQCRRDVFEGAATSATLSPGFRFTIEEHPSDALNTELLVLRTTLVHDQNRSQVSATGGRSRTDLHFVAIPTDRTSYRPERRPAARSLPGAQTGLTTGPSGQEIHVDDAGRVTVIFPWDRAGKKDDTASMPMRTLQLPTGGSMLLPRVGWEVLVQHDEGDLDLPLVMARIYNAMTPPPYALPGGAARSSIQTATTPGGGSTNELRTDDTKGSEEMFFNASKDMTIMVNHNETETIANNATLQVGSNRTIDITNSLTVDVGADQSLSVSGNQKNSIETFKVDGIGGNHTYSIGGNRDMKVGGDHKHTVGGNESLDVGSIETTLVVGKVSETVSGNVTEGIDAAEVALTVGDYNQEIAGNHNETITAAKVILSFGGTNSDVSGTFMQQTIGAKINKVDGDRSEKAGALYTAIAAGANIIKADNITFEADGMITLVMGASIMVVTPAAIAFLGVSLKADGATAETAALVLDN
ncbi:MAG: type VI secretion system tip protein TssI/VgrG [Polyangiaceae bacterium]